METSLPFAPAFEVFAARWWQGRSSAVVARRVCDLETPVSLLLKLGRGRPHTFLLESVEGGETRGRYSILGRAPDLLWRCIEGRAERVHLDPEGRVTSVAPETLPPMESLESLLATCRLDAPDLPAPVAAGLFGYLGYDLVSQMERVPALPPSDVDVPEALLMRPRIVAILDHVEDVLTLVTPAWFDAAQSAEGAYDAACARLSEALSDLDQRPCRAVAALTTSPPASRTPSPTPAARSALTPEAFKANVDRAKAYIRAGDIFQVVLSQRFERPFSASPLALYRTVRRIEPSPFLFFFDFGAFSVVGSSPEVLVRLRDGVVTIRPIAGTRPRGQGNRSDAELEEELLADPKERAEHLMLLDLGRNDVGRVAAKGTVRVTAQNTIERYHHVMHIVSNVEGDLEPSRTALDALRAGFPAGTVSGAPKIRAMQIIAEMEPQRRGVYAGALGYFGADGSLDTCIAIRTGVVKDGMLYVQAGAGIVYDSDPETEHRECLAKARGLLQAAALTEDEGP